MCSKSVFFSEPHEFVYASGLLKIASEFDMAIYAMSDACDAEDLASTLPNIYAHRNIYMVNIG